MVGRNGVNRYIELAHVISAPPAGTSTRIDNMFMNDIICTVQSGAFFIVTISCEYISIGNSEVVC